MANLFGKPMEWDNNMDAFDDVLCLCAELSHVLPLKVGKLSKVCSSVYGGWKSFFDELIRTGAVLEAHPDAHMHIRGIFTAVQHQCSYTRKLVRAQLLTT